MNKYGNFKCAGCGSENIKLDVAFDGLDEYSVEGEGSGFKVVVSLACDDCGRMYPVCRTKKFTDVSDISLQQKENAPQTEAAKQDTNKEIADMLSKLNATACSMRR